MLNKLLSATILQQFSWTWPTISPAALTIFILVTAFGILSVLEQNAPKIKLPKKMLRLSYQTNFSLFIFNSLIMSFLSATSLLLIARQHIFPGLLSHLQSPSGKVILSFLAIDLLLYGWHKLCHHFDGLWMFHRVHHNDPSVNVSTGFRLHIVELLMTHVLKALLIIFMGIDELIVLVSEIATTLFVMLHHTNIGFKAEKYLGLVFIMPYLHRTHHSVERNEHDSNYGAVLSIWDRIFGTMKELEPSEIGIKGSTPLDFINLVKFGFAGPIHPSPEPITVNLDAMIAEAAYYRAEKRNFGPGQDMSDWLEAKKDIIRMVYGERRMQRRAVPKSRSSLLDWLQFPLNLKFRL
jgi:sterol desaturase/sphingolipid hydroxylase (fatty acid hydroxylase superfamily)